MLDAEQPAAKCCSRAAHAVRALGAQPARDPAASKCLSSVASSRYCTGPQRRARSPGVWLAGPTRSGGHALELGRPLASAGNLLGLPTSEDGGTLPPARAELAHPPQGSYVRTVSSKNRVPVFRPQMTRRERSLQSHLGPKLGPAIGLPTPLGAWSPGPRGLTPRLGLAPALACPATLLQTLLRNSKLCRAGHR